MNRLLKKFWLILLVVSMTMTVAGCGVKHEEKVVTQEGVATSTQEENKEKEEKDVQEDLPEENVQEKEETVRLLKGTGEIIQYSRAHMICIDEEDNIEYDMEPFGIIKDYDTWKTIAMNSPHDGLVDRFEEGKYDEKFFEENMLVFYITATSGGMEYEYESTTLSEENGKQILTINVTYSTDRMVNSLASYFVFAELEKDVDVEPDEFCLEKTCRK